MEELRGRIDFARKVESVGLDDDARLLWEDFYTAEETWPDGAFADFFARAPSHVLKLALMYSLLTHSQAVIKREDLEAALSFCLPLYV